METPTKFYLMNGPLCADDLQEYTKSFSRFSFTQIIMAKRLNPFQSLTSAGVHEKWDLSTVILVKS
jgi:hypothetical protein